MLVTYLRAGESIQIGDVTIRGLQGSNQKIGIEAPRDVDVTFHRRKDQQPQQQKQQETAAAS